MNILLFLISPALAAAHFFSTKNDKVVWTYDASRKVWLQDVGNKIKFRKTKPFAAYSLKEKVQFYALWFGLSTVLSIVLQSTVWKHRAWAAWIIPSIGTAAWVWFKVNDEREKV